MECFAVFRTPVKPLYSSVVRRSETLIGGAALQYLFLQFFFSAVPLDCHLIFCSITLPPHLIVL